MTSLEQIVLPLAESRALAEKGIVLDTALVWVGLWGMDAHWHVQDREQIEAIRAQPELDRLENGATVEERGMVIVGAPVLSELLDAIYARYDNSEITMYGSGLIDVWIGKEAHQQNEDTDLLAAASLLLEVAK